MLKFLLDTDILGEHLALRDERGNSVWESLVSQGICFTTVLNATELFLKASNKQENDAVLAALSAIHVLGVHQRYALLTGELREITENPRDLLFLSVAAANKLPIVTFRPERYGAYAVPFTKSTERIE